MTQVFSSLRTPSRKDKICFTIKQEVSNIKIRIPLDKLDIFPSTYENHVNLYLVLTRVAPVAKKKSTKNINLKTEKMERRHWYLTENTQRVGSGLNCIRIVVIGWLWYWRCCLHFAPLQRS